jgi:hypothetical protein
MLMAPERQAHRRYRCKYCSAWLPAARAPDGALLLGHLAQQHPDEVGAYLGLGRTKVPKVS